MIMYLFKMESSDGPNLGISSKVKQAYDSLGYLAIIHISRKEFGGNFAMVELYAIKAKSLGIFTIVKMKAFTL
jgi:hypothetical protein